MLMTLLSLVLSLVYIQNVYALPEHQGIGNQIAPSQQGQQANKDATPQDTGLKEASKVPAQGAGLPSGDKGWAVQIVSRGGFTGSGGGAISVTSDGSLVWNGADGSCSRKLTDEAMQALTRIVLAANTPASAPAAGSETPLQLLCNDCYVITMTLQRRGIDGDRRYKVSWNDASQANVPLEMMTLYGAVMVHRGCTLK